MKDLNFKVDKEKCVKCGLCVKDCLSAALTFDKDGYPQEIPNKHCLQCQHCMTICPKGAISVLNKNPEDSVLPVQINPEDMFRFMANHRSCRQYVHENIDSDKMEKLKNILKYTPTGCNFKNLHFAVVDDVKVMDSIRERLLSKMSFLLKFLPTIGILRLFEQLKTKKEDVILRNAPHMLVVAVNKKAPCKEFDPVIALSYFELYAQSLGLGTLWCGMGLGTLPLCKDIMKRFEIPKTHKLVGVMLFGKPKVTYIRGIQPENTNVISVK